MERPEVNWLMDTQDEQTQAQSEVKLSGSQERIRCIANLRKGVYSIVCAHFTQIKIIVTKCISFC